MVKSRNVSISAEPVVRFVPPFRSTDPVVFAWLIDSFITVDVVTATIVEGSH